MCKNKFFAFTLAEVLITLGIIGIIAAMTLPSIMAKTREKETVTRLKKVYVTLENAYRLAKNEHSDITNWFNEGGNRKNTEIFYNNLKPYLKVTKECGFNSGCLTPGFVKSLEGANYRNYEGEHSQYAVILADGVSLLFYLDAPPCRWSNTIDDVDYTAPICGNIKVDIDGKHNGQYTFGKDFFIFDITPNGIIPSGMQSDTVFPFTRYCNMSQTTSANGRSCTAWVIYNENMDYLHCNDLSWSGKKTCK